MAGDVDEMRDLVATGNVSHIPPEIPPAVQQVIAAVRNLVADAQCDCDEAYTGRGMHAHDCLWRWADDYDLHELVRALDGEG
jgi:hypothetical protein